MSEEKNDKILQQKLQNLQFPFDAQAWNNIEAMLNKEQKKRGFVFWWLSALSTLLLIGGTTFYFYFKTEKNNTDNSSIGNTEKYILIETITTYKEKNTTTIQQPITNNSTLQPENNFDNNRENNNAPQVTNSTINNFQSKQKTNYNDYNNNYYNHNNTVAHNNQLNNSKAISKNNSKKLKRDNTNEKPGNLENIISPSKNNTSNNETLIASFITSIDKIIFEAATMEFIDVKKEEDKETIKAPNKKKVHYAFGVSGFIAATTVGNQENFSRTFFSKPYYAVGFAHELQFRKRIAVTNAFQFSKNYFEIYNPQNNTFEIQPERYSSSITTLNIPLGIKYSLVAKEKFKWHVHVGINNHIKLKENFEFLIYYVDTTQPNSTSLPTNVSAQTNLSGGSTQYEASFEDFSSTGNVRNADTFINNTSDFSINSAKRYYASAYVATGVTYILKNKWCFFVEPTYQFSLNSVGIQQKRIHHFGLSSGFLVRF